jgi:hypothetical protein
MKNTKTKIILSVTILLSVVGFVGTVNAAGSSLYVSPASLTKTAGEVFSVSVGFNASGNKVCAVEGTIVFNNLTCQSITVASDVMAQSSPTCSNPHFLIGIPGCTTSDKVLLTLSVKAGAAGTASVNATGVDIIGEGASVGSTSIGGNYTINAVPIPTPTPETPITSPAETPIKTPVKTTTEENVVSEEQPVQTEQPVVTENISAPSFLATVFNFSTFGKSIRTIVIIAIIAFAIYSLIMLLKKKNKNQNIPK